MAEGREDGGLGEEEKYVEVVVRDVESEAQEVVMRRAGFGKVLYVEPRLVYLYHFPSVTQSKKYTT